MGKSAYGADVIERTGALAKLAFFGNLTPDELGRILTRCEEKSFANDERIIDEGRSMQRGPMEVPRKDD